MGLVFVGAAVALIVIGIRIALRRMEATRATWRAAAQELGLGVTPGKAFSPPTLSGSVASCTVTIDTFTQGSGNSNSTYTRYRAGYPDLGLGLALKQQSAISRITRLFGAQDVAVGDDTFDAALVVKAEDPDLVRTFLTPARRAAVMKLFDLDGRSTVDDAQVTVVTSGAERNQQRIISTARRVIATATRLHDPRGVEPLMSRALERRLGGDLEEASREIGAIVHAHPDDIDGRLLEIDSLAAAGRVSEVAAKAEALAQHLPADPEVEGWRRYAADADRTVGDGTTDPVPDTLFEDLFGSGRLSFEVTKTFDERYRGRKLTLRGRVKDARRFTTDRDFGDGPGTKAVITVATIEHDLYGSTAIDAVVALPDATPPLHRGDEVEFAGTLDRIDPMMRNVYVVGAALVTR